MRHFEGVSRQMDSLRNNERVDEKHTVVAATKQIIRLKKNTMQQNSYPVNIDKNNAAPTGFLMSEEERKAHVLKVYEARKSRVIHPEGQFDRGGRWFPSKNENADNYASRIRCPSRAWPLNLMNSARSRKHINALSICNPDFFMKVVESIPPSENE